LQEWVKEKKLSVIMLIEGEMPPQRRHLKARAADGEIIAWRW
jgi:hypothetical protein